MQPQTSPPYRTGARCPDCFLGVGRLEPPIFEVNEATFVPLASAKVSEDQQFQCQSPPSPEKIGPLVSRALRALLRLRY